MAEKPILFSAPMVRAILAGTKTQTRRAIKFKPWHQIEERDDGTPWPWMHDDERSADCWLPCPYGQPGTKLWVRETLDYDEALGHFYKATGMYVGPPLDYEREPPPVNGLPCRAIPSIHMPRWASRITLEVTGVRVERLQDISEADALAEGIWRYEAGDLGPQWDNGIESITTRGNPASTAYRRLWEQINGPGSWDANPWVWVVEFRRLEAG